MRTSRTVRLDLAYDGTDFSGWQRQSSDRSVQGELEAALAAMHGHPVAVVGAGRTDSGVHARGQVAHFHTDIERIPAGRFVPALNRLLPRDLRVLASSEADPDFHARYDARLRRYRYFTACGAADPFRLRYAHQVFRRPDAVSLNAMSALILGERDFTTFASARDASTSRWRFVHSSSWFWEGDRLVYEVAANAFLWRMVRSLVGTMLHFESESRGSPGRARTLMEAALAARDRSAAGPTAPARGLFLWNVEYYSPSGRPGRAGAAPDDDGDDVE